MQNYEVKTVHYDQVSIGFLCNQEKYAALRKRHFMPKMDKLTLLDVKQVNDL